MLAKYLPFLSAIALATPASAWVESSRAYYTRAELEMFHRERLERLRSEVVAQQRADGGQLSRVSRTKFQSKLDRLNRQYLVTLRRYDPFSVNGMGHPVPRNYSL